MENGEAEFPCERGCFRVSSSRFPCRLAGSFTILFVGLFRFLVVFRCFYGFSSGSVARCVDAPVVASGGTTDSVDELLTSLRCSHLFVLASTRATGLYCPSVRRMLAGKCHVAVPTKSGCGRVGALYRM